MLIWRAKTPLEHMKSKLFSLILEDGSIFSGSGPNWQEGSFLGEVVFTTGMTGYSETLTDPSYSGQILTFTYPLIGNYGIPSSEDWESRRIHLKGVIVAESCEQWSHYRGMRSLEEWLKHEGIPLLTDVDTRAITKKLRAHGTMRGVLTDNIDRKHTFDALDGIHHVALASENKIEVINPGKPTVIVVDCGMKLGILRHLKQSGLTLKRVPYDYDYTGEDYAGVFVSNGPGDPACCTVTVDILRRAMQRGKPIFGICLGTQIMALAAGARTYKLPYGHRGHNQPCVDVLTGRCYMTSQNHGYAVDENSLPEGWEVAYRNLNDGSVEGIRHKSKPFFSVQFHPEAAPGPTDTCGLFQEFFQMMSLATCV